MSVTAMNVAMVVGACVGYGAALLGYHLGRTHERRLWVIWLDARIPRLKGQRP